MRNRSPSPLQAYPQHHQASQKKYYTREQVSQILRAMMQSKLSNIYQELQQKQQIIRALNEKLNKNDSLLQHATKQLYELSTQSAALSDKQMEGTVDLINQMLHERLQGYWQVVQGELDKIRTNCQDAIRKYHQGLQTRMEGMLGDIRKSCEDNVQAFKKKNNGYWIKVKEALNKMNARTVQCEEKIGNIGVQINKYETERQENYKTLRQLQNGKNTAKMLVQLKKSVTNVYKNFEEVLKLQKTVKESYQKMGSFEKWNCQKCACGTTEAGAPARDPNRPQWNFNKNTNKTSANRQEDIVILEYSVQEDTLSNHQLQSAIQGKTEPLRRPHSRSDAIRPNSPSKYGQAQSFPLSPITGRVIQNSSFSNNQVLVGSQRYKTNQQTAITNASMKNQTLQWGQHQQYNNFYNPQPNKHDKSQSFHNLSGNQMQFLSSSNGNSRMLVAGMGGSNPATSTSMLNFSLECRKEMVESVRPRLVEMIETKGLAKPIKVFVDQINYLKNEEGNYLFDLKGNMFKLNPSQFVELERDRIVVNVKNAQQKRSKK